MLDYAFEPVESDALADDSQRCVIGTTSAIFDLQELGWLGRASSHAQVTAHFLLLRPRTISVPKTKGAQLALYSH